MPMPQMPRQEAIRTFEEQYWEKSYEELSDITGYGTSTLSRWKNELDLPRKSEYNRVEHTHGVSLERVLYHLHHDALLSVNEISDALGVSRATLDRWFSDTGVYKRGQSEAEKVKNRKMTAEERREQTRKAREKSKEKYGDGGHIGKWMRENPEEHKKAAKKNAHLGAEMREENGMAGATGQDNPNWRGGKNVLDAVKKQLSGVWENRREEAKERDGYECQNCGATDCKLDSHHIVPVMSGGTHGYWNLMTLCESCHHKAEWFTRQYPEFEPVLVE